ncbi:MAG: hypothetical protein KGJ80_16700 [Chloroflexota bacterium]|nr:hypothetical protein [Chloroflexota bacterium]
MPLLPDLSILTELDILIGLMVAAALIVLVADWRLALYALTAQYLLAALLLSQIVQPSAALVRALSGAFAAVILFITFRRVMAARRHAELETGDTADSRIERLYRRGVFVVGFFFRLTALALVVVGIVGIASSMTFLGLSAEVLFSGLWLIATGILVAILSRDVLRLGLGILLFTSGFCILEAAIEGSLFLYGLLNISDLLIAVVIAHLANVAPEEAGLARRRGEIP